MKGFESFGKNVGNKLRKTVGIAGIGIASIAGVASGQTKSPDQGPNLEIASGEFKIIKTNIFKTEEGKSENLYLITNTKTGEQAEVYFRTDEEAKDLGPEYVKPLSADVLNALATEKALKASGLVALDADPDGKLHTEVREFTGYGVNVRNKVLVDEQGRVVKLVEPNTQEAVTNPQNTHKK